MNTKTVLSCNCLNIAIELESDGDMEILQKFSVNAEEQQCTFFNQELLKINKLKSIDKQYTSLIASSNVGDWIIHYCLNCGVYTHAVHKENGTNCVLVTKDLHTSPSVDELRKSDRYSKVFNIIIHQALSDSDSDRDMSVLSPDVESTLNDIKRLAFESINQKTVEVEERIRNFTEKENATLEAFCEKIKKEQSILVRILINSNLNLQYVKEHNSKEQLPSHLQNQFEPKKEKNPLIFDSSSPENRNLVATQTLKCNSQSITKKDSDPQDLSSNDSEGLFDLDGVDEIKSRNLFDSCDSSDNEDANREERYKSTPLSLAKSLPINIPVFIATVGNRLSEGEKEDTMQNPDDVNPSNIAASIKALAKSVHGDAVFGDLPKPRICNQF